MVLFNSFYDSKVSKMEAKPARVDLPVEFGSFGGRRTWGSGFLPEHPAGGRRLL